MIVPVFWNTIIILNSSLEKYNVQRHLEIISTSDLNIEVGVTNGDMEPLTSPRKTKDGCYFYLSNDIASWINCEQMDYEDVELKWKDEVDMLKEKGLKFGIDMIRVNWFMGLLCPSDENQRPVTCEWVSLYDGVQYPGFASTNGFSYEDTPIDVALVWVDPSKAFKGWSMKKIKS